MRKWMREDDLKKVAEKISEEIVIRTYTNGTSCDKRRTPTAIEKVILYNLAYGALLGLNNGQENRANREAEQAIVNTAEIMARLFIPDCNGYDSLYIPLKKAIDEWNEEETGNGQE